MHIRCSSMRAHPSGIGLHPHPGEEIREVHLVIWHSKPQTQPEARFLDSLLLICTAKRGRWVLQGPRHVWKKRRLQTTTHFSFITLLWFKSEERCPTWAVKRRTSSWTLETQKYKAWGLRSNFYILCIHFASSSLKSSFLSQYFKKFWHVCHWILPEPASKTQDVKLEKNNHPPR